MRRSVTCRRIMEIGATPTVVLSAGVRRGVWEKLLEVLIDEPDYEWLMIDEAHCKVHPHAAGAKGDNQDMSRTKGALARGASCRSADCGQRL